MNRPPSRRLAFKALFAPLFATPFVTGLSKQARAAAAGAKPTQAFGVQTSGIFCMEHSPRGTTLATGGEDGVIRLWDNRGRLVRTFEGHMGRVAALAFSPDGKSLASASFDGTVRVWNVATGTLRQVLAGHNDRVYVVEFSPNGRLIASGDFDGVARLWDAKTGRAYVMLRHNARVSGIAFSGDGQTMTTCSFDGLIRSWNLPKFTGGKG